MSRPYLGHGRRHAPGGSDPIPGLSPSLPSLIALSTSTQAFSAGASAPISWDKFAASDSSYYTWSSGTPTAIHILQTGTYLAWLGILPDTDWPAAGGDYIQWGCDVSGVGNPEYLISAPLGAHPGIDTYSPSFALSGAVGSLSACVAFTSCTLTADVNNASASSWTMGVGAQLFVYRISDALDPI